MIVVTAELLKDAVDALGACVGDENLTEIVLRHNVDYLLHAALVEFVENIVEEQDGFAPAKAVDVLKLREFHGHEVGFLLPLRA